MRDDDEILDAYEHELSADEVPRPRRNRGFMLVAGTLALACVFLLAEILANRSIGDDIGTAQHDLRVAQAGAEQVFAQRGSFATADAEGLTESHMDGGELRYVGADTQPNANGTVSVYANGVTWAAAVQIRPGACFYLKLTAGQDPLYGVGTTCTATQALTSKDDRW
jgi:hypothetical protein